MKHQYENGKIRTRWFFWHWYSICSRDYRYDPDCDLCQVGHWVGPVSRWKSRRWYATHYYDGNEWRKK